MQNGTAPLRDHALPIISFGVLMAILYFGRIFFITAITAVIISFILEPLVRTLMRLRFPRSLASFVACVLAGLVLYAAGFATYTQSASLVAQLPRFSEHVGAISETVRQKVEEAGSASYKLMSRQPPAPVPQVSARRRSAQRTQGPPAPPVIQEVRIHQDTNPILDYFYARLGSVYEFLLMASFVPFLVYFMLSWGDHMNRAFLQFFHGAHRAIAAKILQGVGDMVRAFVVGNFLLGVVVAVISCLLFWWISVPFPLLSGALSGFLSIIPYVGLPLALAPPVLAALGGSPSVGGLLLVVLVVSLLHLIALNVLYPKLVGSRVHLNPLMVTFAIMFWSFFWGPGGLLLAIPITAGVKAVCDNVMSLRPYGRFLGD